MCASFPSLRFVDDDVPTTERGCFATRFRFGRLVVVNNYTGGVGDPDSELVRRSIDPDEHEAVTVDSVQSSRPLELCPRARDDQPLVDRAVEIQPRSLELELGASVRNVRAFLVLRNEAEVSPAR